MVSKTSRTSTETVEYYDRLLDTIPAIERKGAATAYTSLNGHMFSFLTKEGILALRLPQDARNKFIEKYDSKITMQYGSVMKEYVDVPGDLLKRTDELKTYMQLSFEYIGSLKPKATKKKRPS